MLAAAPPLSPLSYWLEQPRWPLAQVAALPGRCRGALLRDWAKHCARRWGPDAPERLRADLGPLAATLPDAPSAEQWLPASLQVALTDAILDRYLSGDPRRLEPMLREDAVRQMSRVQRVVVRTLGAAGGYRRTAGAYRRVYDAGRVQAVVMGREARICCLDSSLYGNPTWRILQLFAHRAALWLLAGQPDGDVAAGAPDANGFYVRVRW